MPQLSIQADDFLREYIQNEARRAAEMEREYLKTIEANRLWAYQKRLGWVGTGDNKQFHGPFPYQDTVHKGGMGPEGFGAVNLGRLAKERWCFYPNQVGKTHGAIADCLMFSFGIHWYDKTMPVPNIGLMLTTSHLKSTQINRTRIRDLLPKSILEHPDFRWPNENAEKPSKIVFPNGSVIHLMSNEQDPKEFESLVLDWGYL